MQMRKFYYQHFDNVPIEIDKYYNSQLRHELYLSEKDERNGVVNFGFESEIINAYKSGMYSNDIEKELEERSYRRALRQALRELQQTDPDGFEMIDEFFFGEKTISLTEAAEKHGTSRQAYTRKLNRRLNALKMMVILHIGHDL